MVKIATFAKPETVMCNEEQMIQIKQILLFIILCITFGCENDGHRTDITETNNNSTLIEPTSEFIELVTEIESKGLVSDTSRINKVRLYNLQGLKVQNYNKYLFYNIPYEKSQVGHIINGEDAKEKKAKSIISKVKQIWGYYYREKNETYYIYDGVIEQWSYDDSTSAQLAYKELQKQGDNIYFNTMPYFYIVNNDIFIFHTRAMAFSYEQKALYKEFVDNNEK
jgi:hypothetical protein